jgi:hypothetical protein
VVVAPESVIHSGPTGGVRLMMLNDRAKATWSQPASPVRVPEGVAHGGVVETPGGGAPVNMATGGRGSPSGAW